MNTFFEKVKSLAIQIADPSLRLEATFQVFVEAAMEPEDQVMLAYTQARYVKKNYFKVILGHPGNLDQRITKIRLRLSRPMDQRLEHFLLHPQDLLHRFLHLDISSLIAHLPDIEVRLRRHALDFIKGKRTSGIGNGKIACLGKLEIK